MTLTATPKLPSDAIVVAEVAGDLETEGGSDSFPVDGIALAPTVTSLGDLRLSICLDPKQPETVERGRYIGSIQVGGPGIETASVTLETTLRSSSTLALLLGVIGLIVGLILKMLADLKKDPKAKVTLRWVKEYVQRGAFVVAVILGAIGVALTYSQLYDSSPIWGSAQDMFKMFAAGVTLQITGVTVVDFFKPFSVPDATPAPDRNP